MALIKCKECGAQVSDKAKNCPACGAIVIKSVSPIMAGLIILAGAALLFQCVGSSNDVAAPQNSVKSEKDKLLEQQALAQMFIVDTLKDGDSAKFKDQVGPCGYVNAKNSFGAYTGYVRYIVNYEPKIVAIEGNKTKPDEMDKLWAKICKY